MLFLLFGVVFLGLGAGEVSFEDSLSEAIVAVFRIIFLFVFPAFSFEGDLASASSDVCGTFLGLGCIEGAFTISCMGATIPIGIALVIGIDELASERTTNFLGGEAIFNT